MPDLAPFVRQDFKAVDKHDALHAVKGWLTGDTDKVPIVLDEGRPFGIVNERSLMGRSLDLNAHVHRYTLSTSAMSPTTPVEEAVRRMAELRAAYLPVQDERGHMAGYVRALDLAQDALNGRTARELAVPVTHLREDQTIGEALHAFGREYVEFLPVLRANGRLAGVLRRSDVLKIEWNVGDKGRKDAGGEKISMWNEPIAGFMDEGVSLVSPETKGLALLDAIHEHGFVVVGSGERIVGVITAETIFRPGGR